MSSERISGLQGNVKVLVIPGTDPVGDWVADVVKMQQDMVLVDVVRDLAQILQTLERGAPDLIMVDIGIGILQQSELLSTLAARTSGTAVIVLAMLGEVDMVRQAMLYGAQGFLLKPFSEAELLGSIRQTYELVTQRRAELAKASPAVVTPETEPGERAEKVEPERLLALSRALESRPDPSTDQG